MLFLAAIFLAPPPPLFTFPDTDESDPFSVRVPPHFKGSRNTRPLPLSTMALSDGKVAFGGSLVIDKSMTRKSVVMAQQRARKTPTHIPRPITEFRPSQGGLAWWWTSNTPRVIAAHRQKKMLGRWVGWIHGQYLVKEGQLLDFDYVRWDANINSADSKTLRDILASVKVATVQPKSPPKPIHKSH